MRAIELLAPAKDYASVVAAIDAGADAVYMGASRFGARQAAGNSLEEVARALRYVHQYGAKLYLTLNTLLYEEELQEAETLARRLVEMGVDALIVQDMAFRRMDLGVVELHASTQVANRTPEQVRFLQECGFQRVILERGLSLEEIRKIAQSSEVELECFIHGAICVGYSGRCFLSRAMQPDRSGNRGACSQPCRLSYDLVNAQGSKLLVGKHLLSVRDLNLTARLGELMDAGVSSFKIEGRLKDTNYIRNVVAWYRQKIDQELALRPHLRRSSVGRTTLDFCPNPAKSFTRGFTEYMYAGRSGDVASFSTPKAVGEYLGRVERVDSTGFTLDRQPAVATGDGLCFGNEGFFVNRVEGRRIEPNHRIVLKRGTPIFRNYDRLFTQQVERSRMRRSIPVEAEVELTDKTIRLRYTDSEGCSVCSSREGIFPAAEQPEQMAELIKRQVKKSGDTIFEVERVAIMGAVRFLRAALLTELRREALEELLQARLNHSRRKEPLVEKPAARYPKRVLMAEENVTNSMAEAFYRAHGVEEIQQGMDLLPSTKGRCVMRTPYCIRREIGACLKEGRGQDETLYLEHGRHRYRLKFDCSACEMLLIDESR